MREAFNKDLSLEIIGVCVAAWCFLVVFYAIFKTINIKNYSLYYVQESFDKSLIYVVRNNEETRRKIENP